MSARALLEALRNDQWVEVARMLNDKEPESLHLDFKMAVGGPGAALNDDDLGRIAKAASAFANVEGGVLILGIRTRVFGKGEPDRADKLAALPNVQAAAGQLDRRIAAMTDPPVPGVQVVAIHNPSETAQGVVALFVPQSDGGPHQAAFGDGKGRYFIRTSTNSEPAPHSILAGMFGRQPPPVLRLAVNYDPIQPALNVWIINKGRGIADDAMLRISVRQTDDSTLGATGHLGPFWDRWTGQVAGIRRFDYVTTRSALAIYPDDAARVLSFDGNSPPSQILIRARLDCRNAMPVNIDATVTLDGFNMVGVPTVGEEQR